MDGIQHAKRRLIESAPMRGFLRRVLSASYPLGVEERECVIVGCHHSFRTKLALYARMLDENRTGNYGNDR